MGGLGVYRRSSPEIESLLEPLGCGGDRGGAAVQAEGGGGVWDSDWAAVGQAAEESIRMLK